MSRPRRAAGAPVAVRVLIALLGFVGVTALGGGVEMLAFPQGNEFVPGSWLEHVPLVDSWVVPGVVLGGVLGVGSLVALAGMLRRPPRAARNRVERVTGMHWSWAATLAVGVSLGVWIVLEVVLIPERSVVEAVYLVVAGTIVWLAGRPDVRDARALPGRERPRRAPARVGP